MEVNEVGEPEIHGPWNRITRGMDVNCEGCAGCCVDWRPIAPGPLDHERHGSRLPLDGAYNLVPLTRDEIRELVDAGLGDVMTPRLFHAGSDEEAVVVDGHELAAIDGRPVFYVGLRKPPKPVGPFDVERTWLRTCAFLDPETLQCRIHGTDLYPETCGVYPGQNLALDMETECERVEAAYGGERLLDDTPPDHPHLHFGRMAVGAKVFAHPSPDDLAGVVDRAARDELTDADRAGFVGVAVGSHPGSLEVHEDRAAEVAETVREARSWVGRALDEWERHADEVGEVLPNPDGDTAGDYTDLEESHGAPETPGW